MNKGANTKTANQIAKSLNFSQIDSIETRLIEGSDTPSSAAQQVSMAAAAATCASTISSNLASYRSLATSTG